MRKFLFLVPLVLAGGLFAGFYIGLDPDRNPAAIPSALLDRPVPEFELPPLHDGGLGLATGDMTGAVSMVNFFASWCVPCRAEHPLIKRLAEEGIPVHGVAYKDKGADARAFLAELGDPYTRIGHDEPGRAGIEWGLTGVPETFMIDASGQVRWKHTGPITPDILERDILPLYRELSR